MVKEIYEFCSAVLEQLHGWISGGLLALGVELLDRIWDIKIPRKPWIAIFIFGGFLVSVFGAWQEEHHKVLSQLAYMTIVMEKEPWIPAGYVLAPNSRIVLNFGKLNSNPIFPATEEFSAQELIIRSSPFSLVEPFTPDRNPSTPELEGSAWDEMFSDQRLVRHPTATYDPSEHKWATAFSRDTISQTEFDRLTVSKTDVVYLVGFDTWKDGNGTHGKSFCYWIHPPGLGDIPTEKCSTHNDFIEDANEYRGKFH